MSDTPIYSSIDTLLSGLSLSEQQLVYAKFFQQLKNNEIAQLQNIPEGTVKSRLHAILKKLSKAGFSYGTNDDIDGAVAHSEHKIEMTLDKPLNTDVLDFSVQFEMEDGDKQTMDIPFTLQQPIAKAKILEPNEVVTMQDQRLIIKKIIRTPLRIQVEVEADPSNTMQILALDDASVELSSGNKRESIRNGVSGLGSLRDGNYTFYLQSNYFYDADELILHIGEVHAVNKGEDYIEVDFGKEEIVYKPDFMDWDMKVENNTFYYTAPVQDHHVRENFYPAEKADGSTLESSSSGALHSEDVADAHINFEPYNGKPVIK